jgi:NADH-quinone oxidoreductase subunit L
VDGNNGLIWLTLGLPILGAVLQVLLGKNLSGSASGKRVLGILAVLPIVISFAISAIITKELDPAKASIVTSFPWIDIAGFKVPFELRIDPLSMTMALIITGIGGLIHLYATGYMAQEKDYARFFSYLNLFIAAMLMLVLGNNLLLLFIGWEGVGLCSYLLIGFWFEDVENSKAANKAFIVNRIGDWGLTLGLFLIVAAITTIPGLLAANESRVLSYDVVLPALAKLVNTNPALTTAIALLLFVGACGKSAQFPLYLWLPDAMAGPTPVSALIHAATMVTSGVVLLNRMHVVFEGSPLASAVVCVVGAFTAMFAALIAFGQTDIKKVLAYSTVSQLGFMFVACGSGAYWVGMFHVTTHAFFKALLFLGAGAVIHAMSHEQDMRHYGKLAKYIPITFGTMMIGWLAISGVPLLSGFYSKEAVIGSALAGKHAMGGNVNFGQLAGWTCLAVALLTAMYMTRLMWLTFMGNSERWRDIELAHHSHDDDDHHDNDHSDHHALDKNHKPHEVPVSMWFPLVVLAALSAGGGWYLAQGDRFQNWLSSTSQGTLGVVPLHPHGIPLEALSIGAATLGIVAAIITYAKGVPAGEGLNESNWSGRFKRMRNQYGFDSFMNQAAVGGGADISRGLDKQLDSGLIDGIGVGAGKLVSSFGGALRLVQSGFVRSYAAMMLLGIVGIITWVILSASRGGL